MYCEIHGNCINAYFVIKYSDGSDLIFKLGNVRRFNYINVSNLINNYCMFLGKILLSLYQNKDDELLKNEITKVIDEALQAK